MQELHRTGTQEELSAIIGITAPVISHYEKQGVWKRGDLLIDQIHAYTHRLREQAAGRDNLLSTERARLAKEQADKVAMQNAEQRNILAPVIVLEMALADASRQIVSTLESIPIKIKRRSENINQEDLELIQQEIINARNVAAAVEVDLDALDYGEDDEAV